MEERDAHRLEVLAGDSAFDDRRPTRRRSRSIHRHERCRAAAAARNLVHHAGVANAGQCSRAIEHRLIKPLLRIGRLVARPGERCAGRHDPIRIPKSNVAADQVTKTHNEQPRCDEQDDRQRQLPRHEHAPKPAIGA